MGLGENLVARTAEVALKENRRMLLGVRESPLSAVALENALKLARLGVTIMPLCPPFYFKSVTNEESVGRFVDHMLTTLNLPAERPRLARKNGFARRAYAFPEPRLFPRSS
jgi:4-hydroxy-3-polyprenylbenzoate decarboxylase